MLLDRMTALPSAIETLEPKAVRELFPNPTLISLEGRADSPLFLSVLLHGNETTGWRVLQDLSAYLRSHPLPRSLLIFIGNVRACEAGLRHLPGEMDFNRVWAGGDGPEFDLAAEVLAEARTRAPIASIDIHNNTGTNPVYGCVNVVEAEHLQLLSLFSSIGVYYRIPPTTQSYAFSQLCPAVTLECGKPDTPPGIERATRFVIDMLHKPALKDTFPLEGPLQLYHTVGRVTVAPECRFAFGDGSADLRFPADMDHWNFSPRTAGTLWAQGGANGTAPLQVTDEAGADVTDRYFAQDGEAVRLARDVIPAMITLDAAIVREDCLCYLMEPVDLGPEAER